MRRLVPRIVVVTLAASALVAAMMLAPAHAAPLDGLAPAARDAPATAMLLAIGFAGGMPAGALALWLGRRRRRPGAEQARPRRGTGYASALRRRDLRRLLGALTISDSGSWAYNVALLAFIFQQTGSLAWVGAATIARFVPTLLFSPYAGVLADRFERVRLMVASDVLCVAFQLGLVATAALEGPIVLALVFSAATSLANEVYGPASQAMLPDVAGEEDLAAANALKGTTENLVVIVGPAVGAGILALGDPALVFAVNAASFAVAALIVRGIRARRPPVDVTQGGEAGVLRQITVGFRAIRESSHARVLVALSVLMSFVYGTDTVLFVGVSEEKLGTGPEGFGYLLAALGLGGVIAAPAIDRLSRSPRLGWIIIGAAVLYCVPTVLLVWVDAPAAAFAVQVLRGAATLVVDVLAMIALQRAIDEVVLARVFGIFFGFVLGAIALGAALAPLLIAVLDLDGALVVLGLAPALLALPALPVLRAIDRDAVAKLAHLEPRIAVLERLGLFAAAGRATLERLASAATEESVAVGTTIIREGDEADALYVILEGETEVRAGDRHIRFMPEGSYVGEIGLIERVPRTATVVAHTPCRLLRIGGDDFLEALTSAAPTASLLDAVQGRIAQTSVRRGPSPAGASPR